MRYLLLSLCATVLFLGCNQSSGDTPDTAQTVNQYCPIMGGEVAADGGRSEWNGKTVGFCCPGCKPKWEALSEEDKATKLAEADEHPNPGAHDHGDHDHDHQHS